MHNYAFLILVDEKSHRKNLPICSQVEREMKNHRENTLLNQKTSQWESSSCQSSC